MWAFRVASRRQAGGGHVARCLTLAKVLTDDDNRVLFVLDDDAAHWRHEIHEGGQNCCFASSQMPAAISACMLDGYDFDASTIRFWREKVSLMATIIDQPPLPDWADLIIAPALAPTKVDQDARVLAGLDYALIDQRFVADGMRTIPEKVGNVLVSFGQRDSHNATRLALEALRMLPEVQDGTIAIEVALGGMAPHAAGVAQDVAQMRRATCKIDADMSKCYAAADFVIGGGGVGLLERMAQGIPSVSVAIADNQPDQIARCAVAGGTLDAGMFNDLDAGTLAAIMAPLMRSHDRRTAMSAKAHRAIDGQGAKRCAQLMRERTCAR